MVKMYRYRYKPTGEIFVARNGKSDCLMLWWEDIWIVADDRRMARRNSWFQNNFELVGHFFVANKKESINYPKTGNNGLMGASSIDSLESI